MFTSIKHGQNTQFVALLICHCSVKSRPHFSVLKLTDKDKYELWDIVAVFLTENSYNNNLDRAETTCFKQSWSSCGTSESTVLELLTNLLTSTLALKASTCYKSCHGQNLITRNDVALTSTTATPARTPATTLIPVTHADDLSHAISTRDRPVVHRCD